VRQGQALLVAFGIGGQEATAFQQHLPDHRSTNER
jgi:hypothetical protein